LPLALSPSSKRGNEIAAHASSDRSRH